jgi:TetR/AcrR family transcriptional repressor of nem operon
MLHIIIANEEGQSLRVTREQAQENRAEIINTAARVFRERGLDGIGIADLMKEAGFTHGGFYRHFQSKDELAVQACQRAFSQKRDDLTKLLEQSPGDPFETLIRHYLSSEHRADPGTGCTLTALAPDASRQDNPALRAVFTEAVGNYIKLLTTLTHNVPAKKRRKAAISTLAEMVGAIVLSRAVSDKALAQELIDTVADDLIGRRRKSAAATK